MATLTREVDQESAADAAEDRGEFAIECANCGDPIENPRLHRKGPHKGKPKQECCSTACREAHERRKRMTNRPKQAAPRYAMRCCDECGMPYRPREASHRHHHPDCRKAEQKRRDVHARELERLLAGYKGSGWYSYCKDRGVEQTLTYHRQDHREARKPKWLETRPARHAAGFDDKGKRAKRQDLAAVLSDGRGGEADGRGADETTATPNAAVEPRPSTESGAGKQTERPAARPAGGETVGNDAPPAGRVDHNPFRDGGGNGVRFFVTKLGEPGAIETPDAQSMSDLIDATKLAAGGDRIGPTHRFKEGNEQ